MRLVISELYSLNTHSLTDNSSGINIYLKKIGLFIGDAYIPFTNFGSEILFPGFTFGYMLIRGNKCLCGGD